ncbi:MAG: polysaccharide biosynthesis protein [Bacteroidetes bacterium]|nr:polysaccharide biosynthesis protein [Bacteroidota bacterium]
MSIYKKLVGQTAIYGLSSILGRLLNYLLVPIYTRVFEAGEYGVVTQLYSYIALMTVIFTYGLDISFFRYFQSEKGNPKVYSTSLMSIIFSSLFFGGLIILFAPQLSGIIGTADDIAKPGQSRSLYISMFAAVLAFDAITAIPFAMLRQQNKAKRFVFIRLVGIVSNVGLNLFFLVICPWILKSNPTSWIASIYYPDFGVGYVFVINAISSFVCLILLLPEILRVDWSFDKQLWKEMMIYSFPLMIAGLAGMINETFDRVLIPILIADKSTAMAQLGIYGACYKLSILMTLFIQTFRYAAEPFFFSHSTKENPQKTYADVMNYFVIVCGFIFLGIMLFMDVIEVFIGEKFRSGLPVVPILLMANLCLGVFYNLSIWYKLTNKTRWGAILSLIGAIVTLTLNFALIPVLGYMGAAWTTLICYAVMMIISYFLGQKHYPVPYKVGSFFYFIGISIALWIAGDFLRGAIHPGKVFSVIINLVILLIFIVLAYIQVRNKNSYLRPTSGK